MGKTDKPNLLNYLLRDIPAGLWARVKAQAAIQGVSARQWVLWALANELARVNRGEGEA